jgi:hypothetical protein
MVRIGAADPRADFESDDERRQQFGWRCVQGFRERQQAGDHRRRQLAHEIGQIVIERVGRDAVGERGELRRRAQGLPDHRNRGRRAFRPHHVDDDGGDRWRLPASMTPAVSTKATRARSTASGGASASLKPVTIPQWRG